jgi:tRNA threonylcarbamoyladenosine biosynthesis protein TsaB
VRREPLRRRTARKTVIPSILKRYTSYTIAVLILAFDTSGFAGSAALLDGPQVLAEESLDRERRSAQTLAPAIARLLAERRIQASQIGLVATTIGPGSFTGLRVGVTTAKTFAYAAKAEVLGLSTLEVIAHQAPAELLVAGSVEIHAVLDAQRKELFVGRFRRCAAPKRASGFTPEAYHAAAELNASGINPEARELDRVAADHILAAEAWLQSLPAGAIVTGTGLDKLVDRLPENVTVLPPPLREPQAATVGRLAWRDYQLGRRDDLWKLAPVYLRPSYAEEKARKGEQEA